MIDTHSHIYSEEFDVDRTDMIQRAKSAGIEHVILPNIDSESLPRMLELESMYPGFCHACIGLHPTSVGTDFKHELALVQQELKKREWAAIGETGIDLYWDKTYFDQQIKAFHQQIEWALEYNLPIIIHVRNSFGETMKALTAYKGSGLKGIFHSFTGSVVDANEIINFGGFLLGINGIVTFKNSGLSAVLNEIDLSNIVVETDAPYLAPAPYRGKRNESAYLNLIVRKLAEIYEKSEDEIIKVTNNNSLRIFKKLSK